MLFAIAQSLNASGCLKGVSKGVQIAEIKGSSELEKAQSIEMMFIGGLKEGVNLSRGHKVIINNKIAFINPQMF